jgi:hypothetical protein
MMNDDAVACAITETSHVVTPAVTEHAVGSGERLNAAPIVVAVPYATTICTDCDEGEMNFVRRCDELADDDGAVGTTKENRAVIAVVFVGVVTAPVPALLPEPPPQLVHNTRHQTNTKIERAFNARSFAVDRVGFLRRCRTRLLCLRAAGS